MMRTLPITLIPLLLMTGCSNALLNSKPAEPLFHLMTDADIELADLAVQQALEHSLSLEVTDWYNRNSGNSGTVKPVRTFKHSDGYYCRTYRETVKVGKRMEGYVQTACRASSGFWYPR